MAQEYGLPFLGALPLDIRIREETDSGTPTVVVEPEGPLAARYRDIARRVALALARQPRDLSHKFPTVVVQNR
jgi:ATP-binding protein involved in chromosome partitioning